MRILLDTHIYVWWLADDARLTKYALKMIEDPANTIFVSAASIWEIAIKAALGVIRADPEEIAEAVQPSGFENLPITSRHAVQVAKLPVHHRDPFDRMLVAQSLVEPMRLLTHDQTLARYGSLVLVV